MKKIISTLCLSLILGAASINASNLLISPKSHLAGPTDERRAIKLEQLPQAVKTALASDTYKSWTVKEVTEVKIAGAQNRSDLATQYEIKLTRGNESKTVRFLENGKVDN